MFVGAAKGFHFDFTSVFLRQKDKAMMHIKQMVLMTVTRTLAKVTWSIKEREKGGEGKRDKEGRGENKQQRGQHCKGDILDYEGSSLASDKTELTNLKATIFHTKN